MLQQPCGEDMPRRPIQASCKRRTTMCRPA